MPGDAVNKLQKANIHYQQGQYGDAMRLLNGVIASYPNTTGVGEAYYIRGLCRLMEKSEGAAMSDFSKALTTSDRPELLGRVNAQVGHQYYLKEEYARAVPYYAKAIEQFPEKEPKDQFYYRYADSLQKIGEWRSARQVFPKVWYQFPNSDLANYARRKFSWRHEYFSVQCGAYDTASKANDLADRLRKKKYDAFTEVDSSRPTGKYVVLVGSYPHYDQASQNLQLIQRDIPDAFIVP